MCDTRSPQRPGAIEGPAGKVKVLRKENPLDAGRSKDAPCRANAAARTIGQRLLHFQTVLQPGATLYLNGLYEAATGKEILYFELPL
jgi:hypothetical protein